MSNKSFTKINNIIGWFVGLLSMAVYLWTVEPKGSFFDCGEFLSCGYKLQVTHPPGYPMYVLLARIFAIIGGDNPKTAALFINSMSGVVSGLTIMFLFWTITRLALKILLQYYTDLYTNKNLVIGVFIAGITGSLGYAFSDTFWFNAVEAEVYALSSFFTSLVFWGVLRWSDGPDTPENDRWIIFIFYLIGLSIGVHLLNILIIPTLTLVYYYKKYTYSFKSFILALFLGTVIVGLVQVGFIQYSILSAGFTDVFFVNQLNLPFFSGFIFFIVLVFFIILYFHFYSVKKKYKYLQISVWGILFMLLGYSTYFTSMVRAEAPIPINMFKVDNPMALVSYLNRDQYDNTPLLYGPDYIETPSRKPIRDIIIQRQDKYVNAGKIYVQDWAQTNTAHLFPRMFNSANDNFQPQTYAEFSGTNVNDPPTMGDNINFFIRYQLGWMFARYLMFNFVGRENDLVGYGNVRDGNYISGLNFIDNWRLGAVTQLPATIGSKNKAHNRLFYLPFIFGLLGFYYVFKKKRQLWWTLLLFFVYTSVAIVIYQNQSGREARETDYVFIGAFYVFAIWIGLGALAFITYILNKWSNHKKLIIGSFILPIICLPILMFSQEFDDHNRSHKTLAFDMARNYLESCPPNALLFIFTDNDLYPLFYAQEVEGIRTDVRIVSNNLSKAYWHITRLAQKENSSPAFDILFKPEQIEGSRRNVIFYRKIDNFNDSNYYPLDKVFKEVIANDEYYFDIPTNAFPLFTEEKKANIFPCYNFYLPVSSQDKAFMRRQGWVEPSDSIHNQIRFKFNNQRTDMIKNEMMVYALLASVQWSRPICFTSKYSLNDLGLVDYMVQRGMVFQLLPTPKKLFNYNETYRLITKVFGFGNPTKKNIYFDNENRNQFNFIKVMVSEYCNNLIDSGKNAEANEVLTYFDNQLNTEATPYGVTNFNEGNQYNYYSFLLLTAAHRLKNKPLFNKIANQLQTDMKQQLNYYLALGDLDKKALLYNAELTLQGRPSDLNLRQLPFKLDILGANKMVEDIDIMRKTLNNP